MQFIAAVAGERDSALFVDDAVPGEFEFVRAGMQHAHDLARRSRRIGECGDLSIGCDFAAWNLADDIDDALVEGCQVGGVIMVSCQPTLFSGIVGVCSLD